MSRPAPLDAATTKRMQAVRRAGTAPEQRVRAALRALGIRYRLDSALPGKPDVKLVGRPAVIFVHGCFWHRHAGCARATSPRANDAWWVEKFAGNVRRDERVRGELERRGYAVLTVWECETTDPLALAALLRAGLSPAARRPAPRVAARPRRRPAVPGLPGKLPATGSARRKSPAR